MLGDLLQLLGAVLRVFDRCNVDVLACDLIADADGEIV